uniref:G-patch domain-containing protein n=1 Tax=Romanomermis culicivorax TaxID=13658 RepID=A0A915KDN5_ROMCU
MAQQQLNSLSIFGRSFEDLDESDQDGISKKPLNIENQIVTDEKGRRRFHGAFTGGFSAGYFNTVGSIEGWTPSTFKSGRNVKKPADDDNEETARLKKPEDFMDKEDLGDYGIAPRTVRTTKNFRDGDIKESRKHRLAWEHTELALEADRLAQLVKPVEDSVGVLLLRKMGWRPGKGVGPLISKQEDNDSFGPQNFKFAPEDVDFHIFQIKSDIHGLGYKGLDVEQHLKSNFKESALKMNEKQKKGIQGQAFGVGAFEEDDEDIYGLDDLTRYDFALESTSSRFKDDQVRGEKSTERSVWSFVSPLDRRRLELSKGEKWKKSSTNLDREMKIFEKDEKKNERFTSFMNYIKRGLHPLKPADLTDWEWEQEKSEFENRAPEKYQQLIRELNENQNLPLFRLKISQSAQKVIKNRFTKANFDDEEEAEKTEIGQNDLDKLKAVEMKMFGQLTREKHEWHPDKNLCKRWDVPNPYPQSEICGVPYLQKKSVSSTSQKKSLHDEIFGSNFSMTVDEFEIPNEKIVVQKSNLPSGNSNFEEILTENSSEKDILEKPRPPMDLFEAIFAASDYEESSEEEEKEKASSRSQNDNIGKFKPEEEKSEKIETETYGPAAPPMQNMDADILILGEKSHKTSRNKRHKKKSHKKHKKQKKNRRSSSRDDSSSSSYVSLVSAIAATRAAPLPLPSPACTMLTLKTRNPV